MYRYFQLDLNLSPLIKFNFELFNAIQTSHFLIISTKDKNTINIRDNSSRGSVSAIVHRCNLSPHIFSDRIPFSTIKIINAVISTAYINAIINFTKAAGEKGSFGDHGSFIPKCLIIFKMQCPLAIIIIKIASSKDKAASIFTQVDNIGEIQEFLRRF